MSYSVCMATYNGARHVERQLRTILSELGPDDEVIIVDDSSRDDTVAVIEQIDDRRIRVLRNERNRREVQSFSRALVEARNDVVFLADQDDVWVQGRVTLMAGALEKSGADVVTSNFDWMDDAELPVDIPFDGVRASASRQHLRNIADIFIGRTNYFGCAMAMRREFVPLIAPIPSFVESHDLWIAIASNLFRTNVHLDSKTLHKRKHDSNATSVVSTRSLRKKLWSRVLFGWSLLVLMHRLWRIGTR